MPSRRKLERSHVQLSFALAAVEQVLRLHGLLDTPIRFSDDTADTTPAAIIDTAMEIAAPINEVLSVEHVRR